MPAPIITTITQALTGGVTFDEILSPAYTVGLIIQNRSAVDFFIGDANPANVFHTVKAGSTFEVAGDGTPRKLNLFLGGTAADVIEITALDERQ